MVIIHGYKGSGSDAGAIAGANTFLDLMDANVLMLDWTRGASSAYNVAVANTELVGRQLGLLLMDMINLGTSPNEIHAVGFSLGAHVAGCAAEHLKRNHLLLGRITGLDPASPFFRHHIFREPWRKLDASDAKLVDVIHTDGSEDFADGFGLFKPIGHVDFFPNGGKEQPGCVDVKNSVVMSHFKENFLDKDIACSHIRAWQLFVESIQTAHVSHQCKFDAWPCPQGAISFLRGTCFPQETSEWSQEMGFPADRGPLGIYFLATRAEPPFCGKPLRASIVTSDDAPITSGILYLKLLQTDGTTIFKIRCYLPKRKNTSLTFHNIAAATAAETSEAITVSIWYRTTLSEISDKSQISQISTILFLNAVYIEDRKGNRWQYCSGNVTIGPDELFVILTNKSCTI
ncbi:phospholipase A1 member A-like [Prorops nasuta]|uniref:phospholipase A1 member A-like n=1 Tax=Prorops nasuta TaxID=863751 RepID=UPI0034CD2329